MKSAVIVLEPNEVEIPMGINDLTAFQNWVHSVEFPETGRFDWLHGRLEVEVAPEDLGTHGGPKSTIAGKLVVLLQEPELGHVYIDRARLTCPSADLSVEPDVLVVLDEAIDSGRVRLVPKASGEPGRFVEVEGAADLVVECVSDGSVRKDLHRLRELYHRGGIREYWVVDARCEPLRFDVLIHRPDGYVEAAVSVDGFRHSQLLSANVRLVRTAGKKHGIYYKLDVR